MKYDFLTLSRPRSRALEDPKKEMQKVYCKILKKISR